MAKVTATDGNGNNVPVLQVQFNNRGEVESFLTQKDRHQKWVHARDYKIEVSEGEQPVEQPGIMTKDTSLKANETIKKDADVVPPADPVKPAVVDDGVLTKDDMQVAEGDTLVEPTTTPETPTAPSKPTKPAKK